MTAGEWSGAGVVEAGKEPDRGMDGPVFVLVAPQMGENIGAAARAMWNFGLDRMRLVSPRDGWPNPRAVAMASGAGRVLDQAGLSRAPMTPAPIFPLSSRPPRATGQ